MVNELEGFLKMNGSEEKLKKIYINKKQTKFMKAKKYSKVHKLHSKQFLIVVDVIPLVFLL